MNIKSFIIERGLSVKQVADNMGISSPALSQLLSGNPTVQKIQDIAEKGIGCKRWELFADEMDVKDVLERFKDQFEEEIQRRVAAAVEETEQRMAREAQVAADKYELTIEALREELEGKEPTAQQAIFCPACGKPMIIKVVAQVENK